MRILDGQETRAALPFAELIQAIREMFAGNCEMPLRHHHTMSVPGEPDATLLLMPCWLPGDVLGVKQVCVTPGNSLRGIPAVTGTYVLSDARTGAVLAILDGSELTARRTAAASALAADYLARKDARHLLVVGAGRVAANLIEAYGEIRELEAVSIWARDGAKAQALAEEFTVAGIEVAAVADLEAAVRQADIVSCATLSTEPLILGDWLMPGTHLDLIGGFTPAMREADDVAIAKASVFVDTRTGGLAEAGDIVQPIANGVMSAGDICADLYDLCLGRHGGRKNDGEITFFKSVGAALEDLAAAKLAVSRLD